MNDDLTTEQIEKEQAELIDRQESEIVVLKSKVKKDPKII